jgi:hypothetical protein
MSKIGKTSKHTTPLTVESAGSLLPDARRLKYLKALKDADEDLDLKNLYELETKYFKLATATLQNHPELVYRLGKDGFEAVEVLTDALRKRAEQKEILDIIDETLEIEKPKIAARRAATLQTALRPAVSAAAQV